MNVIGDGEVSAEEPCNACGDPLLLNPTEPIEVCGIFCQHHGTTHVYHVGCLSEETQVELMLAQMQHQGMIE